MSSNLAIAAVSAVMKYVLQNPLSRDSIAAIVPDLAITAVAPQKVSEDEPHLNIFFYRAIVNTSWVQNGLPSRSESGERVSNPYLALDLYYLITAHGISDYQGEILLGYAMQAFHETPVLTRSTIRTALASPSLVTTDTPANILAAFAAGELADQFEQIRITPYYPPPDEFSQTWTATNISYVPAAHYKISVALIESKRPARSAPPVRSYNLYTLPFKQPRIQDAISETGVGQPIFSGSRVLLRGSALRGDDTRVSVGGIELPGSALDIKDEEISFNLPISLPAGIVGVSVIHQLNIGTPPSPHQGFTSNVVAFILQPRITGTAPGYNIVVIPAGGTDPRRLQITLNPSVGARQRAIVLLNEIDAPATRLPQAYTFEATARNPDSPPVANLVFPIPGVLAGSYVVRVQIDGAQSLLDYVDPGGYRSPVVSL